MEKANVINSNGEITNHIINTLLDNTIAFYGKKYEDIIMQSIRDVDFYELDKKEDMDMVITVITGHVVKKGTHKANDGCFLYPKNPLSSCNYNDTIIYKPYRGKHAYHTLAHELFGHAVCSRENRIVEKDNKKYNRNGIALHGIDNTEWLNRFLNEGAIDFIAESIVKESGIKDKSSDWYSAGKMSMKKIYDYIGKDNFLKTMVLYNYDLQQELDSLIEDGYFDELSYLNDKRYNYESTHRYISSAIYKKKIKKELKKLS